MRVAITGHTNGIGKIIAETLTTRGFGVEGFSRSTGHDIVRLQTAHDIIDSNPDVLINSVWTSDDPWAQYRIQDLFSRSLENKTIIALGSRATDWGIGCEYPMYDGAKEALHKHTRWLTINSNHRVLLARPGLVDTPKFASRAKPKLDPYTLAAFLADWIIGPDYMRCLSEVVWSPEMPGPKNKFTYSRG